MRKILATLLVIAMASGTSFAYVPLSNQQNNLGTFRLGATQGMYYDELDIVSASPVELAGYQGNSLWTNYGNFRSANTAFGLGTYNCVANYTTTGSAINRFLIGMSGNPLKSLIEGSRVGGALQYFGGKPATWASDATYVANAGTLMNLDGAAGNEAEGIMNSETLTILTAGTGVVDEVDSTASDCVYWLNDTRTQWNAGTSYNFNQDTVLGLSLARESNKYILKTSGTKSYAESYLTAAGATNATGVATATVGNTVSHEMPSQETDMNSNSTTDILAQAQLNSLVDKLTVRAGAGLRFASAINPDCTEIDAVTSHSSDVNPIGGTVYYDQAWAIGSREDAAAVGLDFNDNTPVNANTNSQAYLNANRSAAITALSDERKGSGPMLRLEGLYELANVDLVGVLNYASVGKKVDGTMTEREYIKTQDYLTATQINTYIPVDTTQDSAMTGDDKTTNMDLGAKLVLKMIPGVKAAMGAFMQQEKKTVDTDWTQTSVDVASYDDGLAANNPFVVGNVPSPVNGEGTTTTTITSSGSDLDETITNTYTVPLGMEINLHKNNKWALMLGTAYQMKKTQQTIESVTDRATTTTVQTPVAAAATTSINTVGSSSNKRILRTESHLVNYSYGVSWQANKNVKVACNAFLTDPAATASILDPAYYSNLAFSITYWFE